MSSRLLRSLTYLALGNLPQNWIVQQRDPGDLHELLVAELGVDSAQLGGGGEEEHFGEGSNHGAQILGLVLGVVNEGGRPERGEAGRGLDQPHGEGEGGGGELGRGDVGERVDAKTQLTDVSGEK